MFDFFCLWQARLPDQDVTGPATDEEWQNKLFSFRQLCDPPFPVAERYKMQYTCHTMAHAMQLVKKAPPIISNKSGSK